MKSINLLVILATLAIAHFANAKTTINSSYTSLKHQDCITVESDQLLPEEEREIDYYTGVCPSHGGYVVGVSGGDIRYSLFLNYNGKEIDLPAFYQFHEVGEVAEWRYSLTSTSEFSNDLNLYALIYRIYHTEYDEQGNDYDKSTLIVVRLNKEKSCTLGLIPQQKDMNVLARKLADDKNAKCIAL